MKNRTQTDRYKEGRKTKTFLRRYLDNIKKLLSL